MEGGAAANSEAAKGKDAKKNLNQANKGKAAKGKGGKGRGKGQNQTDKPRSRPHRRRKGHGGTAAPLAAKGAVKAPMSRDKKTMFAYGNYDQHYAQRHDRNATVDPRIESLLKAKGSAFFHERSVLDLGCGDGFVSFLAANFGARSVVGVDIDAELISQALRYLRHLKKIGCESIPTASPGADKESKFPSSLVRCQGVAPFLYKPLILGKSSLLATGMKSTPEFPYNMEFRTENAVVSEIDERRGASYDVVLCLNLTKWTHVNFGDDGVKVLLSRCHSLLKPGGLLVLEAQPWTSYVRKNLSQQARQTYDSIKFRPQDFNSYLTNKLGFEAPEYVGRCPPLKRTLQLFRRPGPILWQPIPTPPSKLVVLSPRAPTISTQVDTPTASSGTSCSAGRMDPPQVVPVPIIAPIVSTGSPPQVIPVPSLAPIVASGSPPQVVPVPVLAPIVAGGSPPQFVPALVPAPILGAPASASSAYGNMLAEPCARIMPESITGALNRHERDADADSVSNSCSLPSTVPGDLPDTHEGYNIASPNREAPTIQEQELRQRQASHQEASNSMLSNNAVESTAARTEASGNASGQKEPGIKSASHKDSTLVDESCVSEEKSDVAEPEAKRQRTGQCSIE